MYCPHCTGLGLGHTHWKAAPAQAFGPRLWEALTTTAGLKHKSIHWIVQDVCQQISSAFCPYLKMKYLSFPFAKHFRLYRSIRYGLNASGNLVTVLQNNLLKWVFDSEQLCPNLSVLIGGLGLEAKREFEAGIGLLVSHFQPWKLTLLTHTKT